MRETPYASDLFSNNENWQKQVETVHLVDGFPSCPLADVDAPTSGGTSLRIASAVENFVIPHSQTNVSLLVLPSVDHQPQHMDGSSTYGSSQVQTSTTFQNQLPVSEPQLNKISSVQSYPGTKVLVSGHFHLNLCLLWSSLHPLFLLWIF